MRAELLYIVVFIFIARIINAQIFSISEVDASNFPQIKAHFSAIDFNGDPYDDLIPEDFDVIDLNNDVNFSLKVNCIDTKVEPPVSIVLILDQSQSMMLTEDDELKWNWVVSGASSFVNAIKFVEGTKIAITGFNDSVYLHCDFTNDRDKLIQSMINISPDGGTMYDPAFMDKENGLIELLKTQPQSQRRIAIFLTDGKPSVSPNSKRIIEELQKSNIQVYAITLLVEMNEDLKQISEASGGKAYEIFDKYALMNLYKIIAFYAQSTQVCELSWIAPYGCSQENIDRFAQITFLRTGQVRKGYYQSSSKSIAYIEPSLKSIDFGNPLPNSPVSKNLVLTAINMPFDIDSIYVLPEKYFSVSDLDGISDSTIININESRTISIEFIQQDNKEFRDAILIIDGEPCSNYVNLYGGKPDLQLISPNGGEIFSICDSVEISWTGVSYDKPVNLFYSSNNGITWQDIEKNIRGLKYKWKTSDNNVISNSCNLLIKVQIDAEENFLWANSYGGLGNDFGNSISLSSNVASIYLAGNVTESITINSEVLDSHGEFDIIIQKIDSDGSSLWTKQIGSPENDSAACIVIDFEDNIYVTGSVYSDLVFNDSIYKLIDNKKYCFIAKYSSDGNPLGINFFGATETFQNIEAWVETAFTENNNIRVIAKYLGRFVYEGEMFAADNEPQSIELIFDNKLEIISLSEIDETIIESSSFTFDADSILYATGTFKDTISKGKYLLESKGSNDIFVSKSIYYPESFDISDSCFMIAKPNIFPLNDSLDFGKSVLGFIKDTLFYQLINTSPLMININKFSINGIDKDNFIIASETDSLINPYDSLFLKILFLPERSGLYEAELTIFPQCSEPYNLILLAEGICFGTTNDTINFNSAKLYSQTDSLIKKAFINKTNVQLQINPIIEGDASIDYDIINNGLREVKPLDTFDILLKFIPTKTGLRESRINFQVQNGCENSYTYLKGIGLEADFSGSSIDWKERRLLTINDSSTKLINTNPIPIIINSISIDDADNVFTIKLPMPLPYEITAYDTLEIPISFVPKEDGEYKNSILVNIESFSDTLFIPLRGVGILPRIAAEWFCNNSTKPREISTANLLIKNTSSNAGLNIYNLYFSGNNDEFSFIEDSLSNNLIINKADSSFFDVLFSPKVIGTRYDTIIIISDASPGPNDFPLDTIYIPISCEAKGFIFDDSKVFNDVLSCTSDTITINIFNAGGYDPLSISSYEFSVDCINCEDSLAFRILNSLPLLIMPKDSATILFAFKPEKAKEYNSTIILSNNWDEELNVKLSGSGKSIRLYSDITKYFIPPDNDTTIIINADIPSIENNQEIKSIHINIVSSNNSAFLQYRTLKSSLPNWVWKVGQKSIDGMHELIGNGVLQTPYSGELFSIKVGAYLGEGPLNNTIFRISSENCLSKDSLQFEFELTNICFEKGRYIVFGNYNFYFEEPQPNPASNNVKISFGIGIDSETIIDIYNNIGLKATPIISQFLKSGKYELDYQTSTLAPGIYYLRIVSGSYTATKRLIILR